MTADLTLRLLGSFRAEHAGDPVAALDAPRLQALLAYLVLHRDAPQQRHRIAFRFWPDTTESQALTNLRQLLHLLRRALPEADRWLHVRRRTLQWRPRGPADVDIVELETAWAEADRATEASDEAAAIDEGERAIAVYAGDLLPSCYDEWIEPHRDRLRRRTLSGLERHVGLLEARREYRAALEHAERLVALDPLRERAQRLRIRLYALAGDAARAARAFRECADILERELGVEPSRETRELHERVRRAVGGSTGGVAAAGSGDSPATIAWPGGGGPLGSPEAAAGSVQPARALVGRDTAWRQLVDAWRRAGAGRPGLALIRGEAGIGKTRLAEALEAWAARQGVATARARCYLAEGMLPFGPVAQWLRTPRLRDAALELDTVWLAELARLLPELRQGRPELSAAAGRAEPWRRARLFEALARAALAVDEPLLLLLDDLQWCDGDTLEWLHYLLRFDADAPLLLLATLRSGEPATDDRLSSWLLEIEGAGPSTDLALGPLDADETAALAAAVASRPLAPDAAAALYDETEGNPLFVVETVRSRTADGNGGAAGRAGAREGGLPPKVEAVIRSRLERLSPAARELVPLLATIGRDFNLSVIRAAARRRPERLAAALDELAQRHVIREHAGAAYDFTHDKIREVAYAGLSTARRTILHERVADALKAAYAAAPDRVAGEIARHLEHAGRGDDAIPWYRRAADRALAVYANAEAVDHLRRALAALGELPDDDARAGRELELQTALGVALVAIDHYRGARAWEAYTRARDLSRRVGRPASAPILRGLALASLMRSRVAEVLELGRELMAAAQRDGDPMLEVEAHYVLGVAHYWEGRIPGAQRHLERALELYDPDRARTHLNLFAQDPGIVCGVRLALAEWHLGATDAAHRRCVEAIERAEALGHPFSRAYARWFGSWVLIECGDIAAVRRQTVALLRESDEHALAVWPALGGIVEGWLRVEDGHADEGLERMRAAASAFAAQDADLGFPYHQALYARACRRAGRTDDGLAAIDEALAMAERTGERFWDAELHRLRGDLLRDRGAPASEAEPCYDRALEIARAQGAAALAARVQRSQNGLRTLR